MKTSKGGDGVAHCERLHWCFFAVGDIMWWNIWHGKIEIPNSIAMT
jgi:hypothetical protein